MKTIFITIYDGGISKNILRTDVFRMLKSKCKIVLFVPSNKVSFFRDEFQSQNVIVEITPPPTNPRLETAFAVLGFYSLHTITIYYKIYRTYKMTGRWFRFLLKYCVWQIGRAHGYQKLFRAVYYALPDTSFDEFFEKHKPDLIFVPNMISKEDFRLLKTARRRNVPSVGIPKSWDTMTSKTFFNIFPDWLLLQTNIMKKEAIDLYNFPPQNIAVVGFPQFDIYSGKVRPQAREAFCRAVGLHSDRPIILYAASGDHTGPHDEEVLRALIASIAADEQLRESLQLLVRPHPKYKFRMELIPKERFVFFDYPGIRITEKKTSWEFKDNDIIHLLNTLCYSDIIIGTMTTLFIEGTVYDKPMISIGFDGDKKNEYWDSVARYYRYDQMVPLVESGGLAIAADKKELIGWIRKYLKDPALHADGRRRIRDQYIDVGYGIAGKRIADYILGKLNSAV